MRVKLSSRLVTVVGAPPFQRESVLRAHPLPDPPIRLIKRADGGFDEWPDRNNAEYGGALTLAIQQQNQALWSFYCETCIEDEPDTDWRNSDTWLVLAGLGVQPRSLKLDWVEYDLIQTEADRTLLAQAFKSTNEIGNEDRSFAQTFFGATWNGIDVYDAAKTLKKGKVAYNTGFAEFAAAKAWGLLPLSRKEVDGLSKHLRAQLSRVPLYYDLPPRLRALLETHIEIDMLFEALRIEDSIKPKK